MDFILYLVLCQVQSKDGLMMATMTVSKNSAIDVEIWCISNNNYCLSGCSAIFFKLLIFFQRHFSFVELVTVKRINTSHL